MARPKRRISRTMRVDKCPEEHVAAPAAKETRPPSGPASGPAFTVVLKKNHFCFAGGSKFVRIPRRFVEAQRQYGDRFGPHDWVELSAVGDPSFKYNAVLVRNERRGTLHIGEGFEKFASQYALQPGNCLCFILVAASQFKVDMCNDRTVHKSEEDRTDEYKEEGKLEETVERNESRPRITEDDELVQAERAAQILLQQRPKLRPMDNQKLLKRALAIATSRERHVRRSMSKTMPEMGGGSGDKGGPSVRK